MKEIAIKFNNIEDCQVCADLEAIRTVVRNLISNAIKYSKKDEDILINLKLSDNEVITEIVDNGLGISDENKEKIFKIDAKFLTKGTAGEKGTGLGLNICKELIEKNDGRLDFSTKLGSGSTFYFILPLAEID